MEQTPNFHRTPRRRPLSDLTNTSRKPSRSSARLAAAAAAAADDHGDDATPSTVPRSKQISPIPDGDFFMHDISHSVAYTNRSKARKNYKGKALSVVVASSCPPIGRLKTKRKLSMVNDQFELPAEIFVPYQKVKKRRHTMPGRLPELPQDFAEKQRAYFAEVDAFELPEEFASESDIESVSSRT